MLCPYAFMNELLLFLLVNLDFTDDWVAVQIMVARYTDMLLQCQINKVYAKHLYDQQTSARIRG